MNSYRSQLALVSQEPTLYQGTIRENICLGSPDPDVTDEAVLQACREANIYDLVMSLPYAFSILLTQFSPSCFYIFACSQPIQSNLIS